MVRSAPARADDDADAGSRPSRARRGGRLRRVLMRLLAIALAVLLTLGVVEVVFRLLGYEAVYDVYSSPEAFLREDPVLGWSLTPGARGEFVGPRPFPITFRADVRVNSLGLRGPEIPPLPPEGLRVLVLGDSWTAGFEVPEDRTYSALLAGMLTERLGVPVQVLNAGVRGYGTDQALLAYRERLRALDPDLVLHHTTGNDPDDNVVLHRMRRVFSKPAFALTSGGEPRLVGHPVPEYPQCSEFRVVDGEPTRVDGLRGRVFCRLQTGLADHSAFFSFVTRRLQGNPDLLEALYGLGGAGEEGEDGAPSPDPGETGGAPAAEPELAYPYRLTTRLIQELAREAEADGARFALAGVAWDLERLDVRALEGEDIPLLRIESAIADEERVLIPNDGHPNEAGHREIAEVLLPDLVRLLRPMTADR